MTDTPALTPKWEGAFETFQDWVNHASSWLAGPFTPLVTGCEQKLPAMCVDSKGRRCYIGADFMRARDENAFPVFFFWECEPKELMTASAANLLRNELESCPCPRPANAAPDDTTIGQCMERLECGCRFGGAILAASNPAIAEDARDGARYRYLRNRPEGTIGKGGVFAGKTPPTGGKGGFILTEEDLDRHVDEAMAEEKR